MRKIKAFFPALILGSAVLTAACSDNPVAPPPPPTADPPKISCPAPVTVTSPNGQPIQVTYGAATVALGAQPVSTTCSPASGAVFPIGTNPVTCTATDALNRTDSCTFAVTVTRPPQILLTKFVAFGDSMTWGEDGQNSAAFSIGGKLGPAVQVPAGSTYPAVLQSLLAARYSAQSFVVFNAGCRGELAANVVSPCASTTRARFDSVIAGGVYQAVLLLEGANDLSAQFTTGSSTYSDAAIAGLQAMIGDARRAGMRVFLATLPPENPLAGTPARRGQAAALVPTFNERIKALAFAESAVPVDVYQAFNGDVTTLIGPDGLHPTVQGYSVIANTFFNVLKQTLETTPPPTPTTLFTAPASLPARTGSFARPAAAGPGSRPAPRKPR